MYIRFFNHPKTKGNKFKSRIHIALSKNIFVDTVRSSSDSFDESSDESTEYRSDEETMSLRVSFPPFLLLYILPCVKSL